MTDLATLDALADEWAARHNLRVDPAYGDATSFARLFTSTNHDLVATAENDHFGAALLDRSRAFKAVGGLRDSVVVSAPSEAALLRAIGSPARIVVEIWALAAAIGFRVRVGSPLDAIYSGDGTVLPIVWWDPERISLPYAPLA
jgi:hypothetical protein